jgi:hypothetical protein
MLPRSPNALSLPAIAMLALLAPCSQAQTPQIRRPTPIVRAGIVRAYGKLPLTLEAICPQLRRGVIKL